MHDYSDPTATLPDAHTVLIELLLALYQDDKPRILAIVNAAKYVVATLPADEVPDEIRRFTLLNP